MARQSIVLIQLLLAQLIFGQIETPQSHIVISDVGYYFEPKPQMHEWLNDMYVSTFEECVRRCNENHICRTFDYNVEPNWCRLFEVETSPEQIKYEQGLSSRMGQVQLLLDFYQAYSQPCDQCITNRYLICSGGTCQCPWNTFWNGSICEKKRYAGDLCTDNVQCRSWWFNWTCVSVKACTSAGYAPNLCGLNHTLVLFNYTNNTAQPYTFYSFSISARTTSMIITFSLFNQNAFWLLDNISLIDTNTSSQSINNGGFEMGNLTDWNYCNPNAISNRSKVALNGSLLSQSGQYFYHGAPFPYPDFLSQTIPTVMGRLYKFSFWLSKTAMNVNNRFTVTVFF